MDYILNFLNSCRKLINHSGNIFLLVCSLSQNHYVHVHTTWIYILYVSFRILISCNSE
ncbi:unnamed protein product [Brassica oleracea]